MKLGTLREGNEKKSIVQEPKHFHKLLCSYFLPDFPSNRHCLRNYMRELNEIEDTDR